MIYVYKTTVDSKVKLELATQVLNELLPDALWNFDLEDCDNILRIDSKREINQSILKNNIFDYVELE
ncbi:hypothetical protein [Flavobacterium hercynium]|uniref:Uncharacterized protein n=1 Tax=Flavobacterium hercynium TaxID=387094 RepID=A0A226HDX9_9FLAO|nr:hypothetical protein [Flavobacterium hercynium]OXA92473.1 hypothetical protein B0A66_09310 [Flavobacterium hercynium]SMP21947.1 hypothetical protein SAMN06265346_10796 [Flavobacterium hercynium]